MPNVYHVVAHETGEFWINYKKDRAKLKYRYGITREDYNELLITQNGKCAVCEKSVLELGLPLYIDHNHKTGKVRGLLCRKCNIGLGCFDDELSILLQAADYLKG